MKKLAAAAIAAALCAPLAARADWGIRAGLEAPLATHINDVGNGSSTSLNIGDGLAPAIDVLILKGPSDFIGFGLEGNVGFAHTGNWSQRTGTFFGPTMIVNVPVLPLYARATLPIHVEPSPVTVGLRLAGGLKFNLPFVGIYLEAALDTPFVGGDNTKFFGQQTFSLGLGAELRL